MWHPLVSLALIAQRGVGATPFPIQVEKMEKKHKENRRIRRR
jgi:hypothetical protein